MTLKLSSSGGGSVAIDAPNTGSTQTLTLPDKTATMSPRMILEQFFTPCDGSTITTANGDITVGNVTAKQELTTTYADAGGSSISYTPPAGTTQVIYEFTFQTGRQTTNNFSHWKFYIDSDEVTDAYTTFAAQYLGGRFALKWGINIGGSAVTATGRQASWSSAKTLKWQAREYSSSITSMIHSTNYTDESTDDTFSRPCIGITAIG